MTDIPDPIERLEVGRRLNDLEMRILKLSDEVGQIIDLGQRIDPGIGELFTKLLGPLRDQLKHADNVVDLLEALGLDEFLEPGGSMDRGIENDLGGEA